MKSAMKNVIESLKSIKRRSFIRRGMAAAARSLGFSTSPASLFGQSREGAGRVTRGDVAILRFLAAAEIIETDLWVQYNELGGVQDSEVPGITGGSAPYITALDNSTGTCRSIFTIIPRTKSAISSSLMRI